MENTDGRRERQERPITEILGISLDNLKRLVDADTVVGTPFTTPDGSATVIPVSKVTFGFAAGGADIPTSKPGEPFGGGGSGAMTIAPVAFLVISAGHVELLNVAAPGNSVDRVVDMLPGLADKLGAVFSAFEPRGRKAEAAPPPPAEPPTGPSAEERTK